MPPPMPAPMPPRQSRAQLTWGLILVGVGLALTLALWPIGWIANSAAGANGAHFPLGLGPWMLGGFIPLFVGLALILAHVLAQPERNGRAAPPPYASGGPYAPAPLAPPPPVYPPLYSPPDMPTPEAMGVQPDAAPPARTAAESSTASDSTLEKEETAPPA